MELQPIKSIRFSIRRPLGPRRTFTVLCDTLYLGGRRHQVRVEDPRVAAVNLNMQRGLLDADSAYLHLKERVVPALKVEAGADLSKRADDKLCKANLDLLHKFWEEKYAHSELLEGSKVRAWNLLSAALRDIEPLALLTATQVQIKERFVKGDPRLPAPERVPVSTKTQRRHALGLNQLLTYLGKGFRVEKRRRESKEVDYVTWQELQCTLPHITSPEVRALAIALFGTGVRLGEAFVPGFCNLLSGDTIFVKYQLTVEGEVREIKNRKPHKTLLIPKAKQGYREWCAVEDKARFRLSAIKQIIEASKKAFPLRKEKQVSAHDLRHSYAIHMAGLGASVRQLSTYLGDAQSTVELHYTGFIASENELAAGRTLFKKDK